MLKTDQITLSDRLIDVDTAAEKSGMCRSYLYARMRQGKFPSPAIQSARFTRWRLSDVQAWISDPAGWIERHAQTGAAS